MQSAAFILLFLCYINGFVRGELLMAQDISTGKVYAIDEQDRDPETALVVELDATTTATCVLENLVALNLTDTKRFIRATDCVSIQHFGFEIAQSWTQEQQLNGNSYFKYVETGRGGSVLESYAVVSALQEFGVPIIAYAHHDFTTGGVDDPKSIKSFYRRIRDFRMEQNIIPLRGLPSNTLSIHDNGTIDVVFIGAETFFEDTLTELRQGWRILKPGGVLLGIRAYPDRLGINGVERALLQFCFERGIVQGDGSYYAWYLVESSSYMYYIWKGPGLS